MESKYTVYTGRTIELDQDFDKNPVFRKGMREMEG